MKRIGSILLSLLLVALLTVLFTGCSIFPWEKKTEPAETAASVTEKATELETEEVTEPETEEETEPETEPETEEETEAESEAYPVNQTYTVGDATVEIVSIEEGGDNASDNEPSGRWVKLNINIKDGRMLYDDFQTTVGQNIKVDGNFHSGITLPVSSFDIEGDAIYCKGEATMLFDVTKDTPLEDLDIFVNL